MEIPTSSSKAQDRELAVWYRRIKDGDIKLPRFQRFEAWERNRISSFLNTIIHNLPVGVTLVLEVGDEEKFRSRSLPTAPERDKTVYEHLLDGQQRLTAFWRAMNNNYERETFYVYVPEFDKVDDNIEEDEIFIYCQPRWERNSTRYPIWADDEAICFRKGLIPTHLLRPEDIGKEIDNWIYRATKHLEPNKECSDLMQAFKTYSGIKENLKEVITQFLPSEWSGRLMGQMHELDIKLDAGGYLRLSTVERTTRHMGNIVSSTMVEEAAKLGVSTGDITTSPVGVPNKNLSARFLSVKPIRRFLLALYNRLFWILNQQSGGWLKINRTIRK